jgi:hypothetical protein
MRKPKVADLSTKQGRVWLAAGAAVLVAIVAIVVVVAVGGGDSGSSSKSGEPEIVSAETLRELSSEPGEPIYWAGERAGTELELSQPGEGRTYVRYLTGGAKAGDSRPDFLTVGTYEQADPVAALRRQAKRETGVLGKAPGGATVYFGRENPSSVYLAYPGVEVEIEVYDPNFKEALQLVQSGQIVPAG